jgi:hypothetical protein
MSFGLYAILILFGLFVLLLIFNPNLSCFGRTIRSPFYPLLRKKKKKKRTKAEDYGFRLGDEPKSQQPVKEREPEKKKKPIRTEDYGFSLIDEESPAVSEKKENKRQRH